MNPAIDFPTSAPSRLPVWALGLSLATHLLVLAAPLLQRHAADVDLPPLAVSFRMPAVAAPVAAERVLEAPQAVPAAPVAVAHASTGRRSARPASAPAVLAVSGPSPESAAQSIPSSAAPAAVRERSEPTPSAPRAEAAAAAEIPDAAAMARYIRLLGDLLAQQQQYPRLAAVRGWEGEVRLRLQVARKGTIIAVQIVHSSGFDVLDQHAVQLVHSTTLPPPPAPAGASPDFLIDIPIHYSLKRST